MKIVPDLRHVDGPLPESVRAELVEDEVDPTGIEEFGFTWIDFARKEHLVVAYEGERPLATAGWLPRTVRAGDLEVAAGALGGVLVRRGRRGEGLSRLVSAAAMGDAAAAGRTHGILLCLPRTRSLWAHLGWEEVRARVTYTDRDGDSKVWPLLAMARPLAGEPWPPGDVDLGGLPF